MAKEFANESKVLQALQEKYKGDAYAVLPHVANSTGSGKKRTADCIVMCMWPSRGLEIEGFEIKCSRSDWLSELKNPAKSAAVQQYCDRWWIVTSSRDIVDPKELPKTWGLMMPWGDSLRVEVAAPKLDPKPVDRGFVASVLRQATRHVIPEAELKKVRKEAKDKAWDEAYEYGKREGGRLANRRVEAAEATWKKINAFIEATGLEFDAWTTMDRAREVGEAAQLLMHAADAHTRIVERLKMVHQQLGNALEAEPDLSRISFVRNFYVPKEKP